MLYRPGARCATNQPSASSTAIVFTFPFACARNPTELSGFGPWIHPTSGRERGPTWRRAPSLYIWMRPTTVAVPGAPSRTSSGLGVLALQLVNANARAAAMRILDLVFIPSRVEHDHLARGV